MINTDVNQVINHYRIELNIAESENNAPLKEKVNTFLSRIDRALSNNLIKDFIQVSDERHQKYLNAILKLILSIEEFQKSGQRVGNKLFIEYSKHEIDHSYTVMNYMQQLFGSENRANSTTYFYLIMVALCHDLGMTIITDDDLKTIKDNKYWAAQAQRYNWEKVLKSVNYIEDHALSIIVRSSHHEEEIIRNKVKFLLGEDYPILSDAEWDLIYMGCYSHGCSIDKIKEMIQNIERPYAEILNKWDGEVFDGVNFAIICSLLRICDLLDISEMRVGDFNPAKATNHYNIINSYISNVLICDDVRYGTNKHCISGNEGVCECRRIEKYVKINFNEEELKKIDDPATNIDERNRYENAYIDLLKYFEQIADEIKSSKELLDFENLTAPHTYKIRPHISERLRYNTEKYKYLKISIDENTILNELMSERLYEHNEMAVRELLQNAIDACQAKSIIDEDYSPKIRISYQNNILSIRDNGIGMSTNVIENYYLKAGKSLYKSNDYKYSNSQFFHAGQFGLGVFSIFMLTSQIAVTTVSAENSTQEHHFTMKKNSRYVKIDSTDLHEFKQGHSGTKIEFELDELDNSSRLPDLKSYIQQTFLSPKNIDLNIYINGEKIELLSLSDIVLKLHHKLNINNNFSIKIDLSNYLKDVSGYIYLEACPSSVWWYNTNTGRFEADREFDMGTDVAVIEVFSQTPKCSDNRIVRFFIPWEDYYANTKQDIKGIETLGKLETLMGQDFAELCQAAAISGDKISIKRFKTTYNGLDRDDGKEISASGCDITKNKLVYVNNILITKHDDYFDIPLPINLPYRVSCLVMNIINFDRDKNNNIGLLLNRNGFTPDTYELIRKAVQFAIFKYLCEMPAQCEHVDFRKYINLLTNNNNFLIKEEKK